MEVIPIINEYDIEEIKEKVLSRNMLLITADYGGSGKSYIFKTILPKDKTLWITPYNKLCFELIKEGFKSQTMYKFLNLNFLSTDEKKISKKVNLNDYEYVVFDEIYTYDTMLYQELYLYINKNKNKVKFFATGDNLQLSAVNVDKKECKYILEKVMRKIFLYNIHLKEIKRVFKPEHKERLIRLKREIFEMKLPLRQIFKDFKEVNLEDIKTNKCICYTNETVQYCNYKNNSKISIGEFIICKNRVDIKNFTYLINYEYIIEKIDEINITIKEPLSNEIGEITTEDFVKYFRRSFGLTVHSIQGLTFNEPITICDLGYTYIRNNPNWLWVAITRNRNLDDIYISYNSSKQKLKNIDFKLHGHILADKEKGFIWDKDEYVDESWVIHTLHQQMGVCRVCLIPLKLNYEERDLSQYSINRIENSLPHIKTNCELVCYSCNCALH